MGFNPGSETNLVNHDQIVEIQTSSKGSLVTLLDFRLAQRQLGLSTSTTVTIEARVGAADLNDDDRQSSKSADLDGSGSLEFRHIS